MLPACAIVPFALQFIFQNMAEIGLESGEQLRLAGEEEGGITMKLEELEPVVSFAIPPLDPRVKLYMRRCAEREIPIQGYSGRGGAQYASLAVYFGSLLFWGEGSEDLFEAVEGALHGGNDDSALRADYAYDGVSKRYLLLRAGRRGGIPKTCSEISEGAVRALEDAIAAHMNRPIAEARLERSERYADKGTLFEGEFTFLEGLVGFGAVPVPIKGDLQDVIHLGFGAVGASERHDTGLLRGLVRDFAKTAHADGDFRARMYEIWLFGAGEAE